MGILGLRGVAVGVYGWLLALIGPVGCVVLCELCKLITKMQKQQYQEQLALRQDAEAQSGARVVHKASSHRSPSPSKIKSSVKVAEPIVPHIKDASKSTSKKKSSNTKGLCQCFKSLCMKARKSCRQDFDPCQVLGIFPPFAI